MRMIKGVIIIASLLMLLFAAAAQAQSLPVTVGWDAYTDTATELRLYIADTPGGAATPIKITPVTLTQFSIPNSYMTGDKKYLRLTAYDAARTAESLPSNEIIWQRILTAPAGFRFK